MKSIFQTFKIDIHYQDCINPHVRTTTDPFRLSPLVIFLYTFLLLFIRRVAENVNEEDTMSYIIIKTIIIVNFIVVSFMSVIALAVTTGANELILPVPRIGFSRQKYTAASVSPIYYYYTSHRTVAAFSCSSTSRRFREVQSRKRTSYHHSLHSNKSDNEDTKNIWQGITQLWDEIIEVSTYGPSERKMLKAQRERKRQLLEQPQQRNNQRTTDESISSRSRNGNEYSEGIWNENIDNEHDEAWLNAFQSAKNQFDINDDDEKIMQNLDYDGYALRDLLLSKWGAPLDIDFQSMSTAGTSVLYCTVLPMIGYGSPLRSRHESEMDYLMHLQGVVEILYKYDNLDFFISFLKDTNKVPKRGTDSVPFRLSLSKEDMERVLMLRNGIA